MLPPMKNTRVNLRFYFEGGHVEVLRFYLEGGGGEFF